MKIKGLWKPIKGDVVFPEEELKRAAKTLMGKPVRVGFEGPPIGYVVDAVYIEGAHGGGGIEYVVEIPELKAAYLVEHLKDNKVHGAVFTELSLSQLGENNED